MRSLRLGALLSAVLLAPFQLCISQTPTLGLQDGFLTFDTPSFSVQLVKDSQTLYSLKPKNGPNGFDFVPSDQMTARQYNGNYHLGDITFRARTVGSTAWVQGDSSASRQPLSPSLFLDASDDPLRPRRPVPRPVLPSPSPFSRPSTPRRFRFYALPLLRAARCIFPAPTLPPASTCARASASQRGHHSRPRSWSLPSGTH